MNQKMEQLEAEISQLRQQVKEYEGMIAAFSAPIIPSIIPQTILVPITGVLSIERFESIRTHILQSIRSEEVDSAIIDFTAIGHLEIANLDLRELSIQIEQLTNSLKLMGVHTYYVGFSPMIAQEMIRAGIDLEGVKVHANFRAALQYLMGIKGLAFQVATSESK